MSTESIKTDKFELMNWIAQLQDLSLIQELKKLQAKNANSKAAEHFKQKIIDQAIRAEEAYKNGDVTSAQDLREESKNW